MMPVSLLITILAGVISLLLTALILQRKNLLRLQRQASQLEIQLLEAARTPERFSEDLVLAERVCQAPKAKLEQELPDRYRYIRAMARQGMNAAQIATILQVGEEEAAQIVRLARLKRDV